MESQKNNCSAYFDFITFGFFNKYISNFKRIVVPNIFENLFPKNCQFISFSLFFYLGFQNIFPFFLFIFVLAFFSDILFTMNKLEKIHLDFNFRLSQTKSFLEKKFSVIVLRIFRGNLGSVLALIFLVI